MTIHRGLRKMTAADAASVYAIEQSIVVAPWSEKLFADCVAVGYETWVMFEEKKIIGYGILSCAANEAHILNLAIRPDRQRQGFGQKMLQHLLEQAKIIGAEEVFLEVRQSNTIAQEMYKKFNFVEIGVRKDYYSMGPDSVDKEDALTFALPLW